MDQLSSVKPFKPFLRWAGGKTWLLKYLNQILDSTLYNHYHEPFLGSGAVFFSLNPSSAVYLSDLNQELMETYSAIKDIPTAVIEQLRTFENTKECYYQIRATHYNDAASRAARFIYLNQTSYNGIYRVNLKGKYNVPFGYRSKPFLEEQKLLSASMRLRNVNLAYGDFCINKEHIQERDLVFLDPPYTVSHNNNGFIKYNQKLFSLEDQRRLSEFIDYIKQRNAYYILTNAAHQTILELFDKNDRVIELSRASLIGGENANRGQVSEYVFTNILEVNRI